MTYSYPRTSSPTQCATCGETKPAAQFHACRPKLNGLGSDCKECFARKARDQQLRAKHGLSTEAYDALVVAQSGRCEVCADIPLKPLVVDHDHHTGTVRALLCDPCNRGLGCFRDDAARMRAGAAYVESHR